MTATNHALTGAVIGVGIGNPWLAIPAALASHYIVDIIPHFGMSHAEAKWLRSKRFRYLIALELVICFGLVTYLYFNGNKHWLVAAVCAFVATTPDFFWRDRFKAAINHKPLAKHYDNTLKQLHSKIQWFEKPIGWVVEVAWAFAFILILGLLTAR